MMKTFIKAGEVSEYRDLESGIPLCQVKQEWVFSIQNHHNTEEASVSFPDPLHDHMTLPCRGHMLWVITSGADRGHSPTHPYQYQTKEQRMVFFLQGFQPTSPQDDEMMKLVRRLESHRKRVRAEGGPEPLLLSRWRQDDGGMKSYPVLG